MSSPPRSGLRGAARSVLDAMGAAASSLQVTVLVRRAPQRGVTVLDIDNTLADTWPSFSRSWPSRAARLSSLPVLPGVKSEIHDAGLRRDDLIVFLSHRSWWHWRVTRRWLRRHGFSVGVANLVLVAQAADKVKHLKRLTANRPSCDVLGRPEPRPRGRSSAALRRGDPGGPDAGSRLPRRGRDRVDRRRGRGSVTSPPAAASVATR